PALIRQGLTEWGAHNAWPSWSFSNHDVKRAVSRWGGRDDDARFSKLLVSLLCSLRGTAFLFQGEELGLPQADVPFEKLQDPEAIRFWPANLGRDGCRTPVPWQTRRQNAGFSASTPWLPVDPRHEAMAIDQQNAAPDSTLNFTRAFLAFRKNHPALTIGDIDIIDTDGPILTFERVHQKTRLLCAFNLSDQAETLSVENLKGHLSSLASGLDGDVENRSTLVLPPFGGVIANVSSV
ncbi:MAG: alpha-amylase family glycosyl hydrolase, partial [Pseudomonadota bacterium]